MSRLLAAILWLPALSVAASAQQIDLGGLPQADGTTVGYIIQMFGLLTVLSVAPGLAGQTSAVVDDARKKLDEIDQLLKEGGQ